MSGQRTTTGNNYQVKNYGQTVKDVDTKNGIVTGYFSSFDIVDSDEDVIVKGAFKKSIAENGPNATGRIKHLLQHNTSMPLSTPHVLEEKAKGLYFESKISHTSYGKDTLLLYADGVFNEHSIGFRTITEEKRNDANYILEVKLWEGSTVTWGANDQTPFTGFKSAEQTIEDLSKRLDKLVKAIRGGKYHDDTYHLLEVEIEQIKSLIAANNGTTEPTPSISEMATAFRESLKL